MAVAAQQLFKAIQHDDQAAVKRALNLNPSLVHAKHTRVAYTPLHSAAALGNLQLLRELLHHRASCQSADSNNETPLHVAARQGYAPLVKELLKDAGRRSCLKSVNRDGATPLHLAAAAGHTDVVQLLLNSGARGDSKDRAGRTPLDLVHANDRELAGILIQGRQLTPGSAGRTRRIISPGVSPTPYQSAAAGPSPSRLAAKTGHQRQQQTDTVADADAKDTARTGDHSGGSPVRTKAVVAGMPGDVMKQQSHNSNQAMSDQIFHHDQAAARTSPRACDQQMAPSSQQSWLQFSPQRPTAGAFGDRAEQRQASLHSQTSLQSAASKDAEIVAHANVLQLQSSAAVAHETPALMGPLYHGVSSAAVYPPGSLALHCQQQNKQQQQQQQQPGQMGPLHSGRAAGPMAAALTRSVDYSAARGLPTSMSQMSTSSHLKQQASAHLASDHPAAGLSGGVSHIVSPETSSGLLNGGIPTSQSSGRDYHAAAGVVKQQHSGSLQQQHHEIHGDAAVRNSLASSRQSLGHMPVGPGAQQAPQQQQQFAALAAAVSASTRVGPLQLPVQNQLNELSAKVHQLEDWYEAQVELIPEWEKVLTVVQSVKRQLDEQQSRMAELDAASCSQHGSLEHLAMQVAKLQGSQANMGNDITHLADEQEAIRNSLTAFGEQTSQLESQLVHQASTSGARMTMNESQLASVCNDISAAGGRLSTLETAVQAIERQLLTVQQQSKAAAELKAAAAADDPEQHCTASDAAEEAAGASARLAALEATVGDLRLILLDLHKVQPAAVCDTTGLTAAQESLAAQQVQLEPEQSAAETAQAAAQSAEMHRLLEEVNELKQRMSDLSLSVCGSDSNSRLQGGTVEEAILPFMETTSNCLQQHEQQLDAIQVLVPQLESVVEQRAQMCDLKQQMAALQTAFSLLPGGRDPFYGRPASSMLSAGPLSSQKAAADYLAMATSMVKLQGQMSALSTAVEQLQLEWETTAEFLRSEHESMRSAWEGERARMSACEREAVRRLADQHKELKAREEKLMQIREAALAEEAARHSQFESEGRVAAALQSMQEQQQLMEARIGGLTEAAEAVREQMSLLQADLDNSLADLAPQLAQMDALGARLAAMEVKAAVAAETAQLVPANTESCVSNTVPAVAEAAGVYRSTPAAAERSNAAPGSQPNSTKAAGTAQDVNPMLTNTTFADGWGSAADGPSSPAAAAAVKAGPEDPRQYASSTSGLYWQQQACRPEATGDIPAPAAGPVLTPLPADSTNTSKESDIQQAVPEAAGAPPMPGGAAAAAAAATPGHSKQKLFSWFGTAENSRSKVSNSASAAAVLNKDETPDSSKNAADLLLSNRGAGAAGPELPAASRKASKWTKRLQKMGLKKKTGRDLVPESCAS